MSTLTPAAIAAVKAILDREAERILAARLGS